MAFVAVSLLGVSCKEDEPFSTITEDDYPKILDPVFPDWVDGEPAVVSQITHDANFTMKLTVTPSDYTEVTWLIDGVEVQKGNEIDIPLEAGTYSLKVVATTTKGQSNFQGRKDCGQSSSGRTMVGGCWLLNELYLMGLVLVFMEIICLWSQV